MFTGIVEGIGTVRDMALHDGNGRLRIETAIDLDGVRVGDSIAVSGACLTVVERAGDCFAADLSAETLARTTLGDLKNGDPVNLETALHAGQPLGGHLVTGHVDGVAELVERRDLGGSERWSLRVPRDLLRFLAEKGSLCVDGVSLTISGAKSGAVSGVEHTTVQLDLIPHTLSVTTLGTAEPGTRFNLEVDLIARYVERLLTARSKDS
jgi:riboflavin synthase